MKAVRLSALRTGRLYPPGYITGTHFCWRLSRPQHHSAARRIMLMKDSNDPIGNWTCNLPACSAVPQPTTPPGTPIQKTVTLVLEHTLTYATRLPHNTKVWNTARRFVYKTLLLTMYGEFWVPVSFIQANGFIQFHLRWDRTRIAWKQTKKVKYTPVTGWMSAVQLWERDSFSCSKFG